MTINKLLAGAAVAALLAGAAQAQVVNTDTGSDPTLPASGAAFIASEFQPAAAIDQLAGDLVITSNFGAVAPFATIPVDGRARLTISLTNATFTTATAASFTANSGLACAFESAAVTGGGVGSTSVGFISTAAAGISTCTSATGESGAGAADGGIIGEFTIPVIRTANGSPVSVTFTYTQVNADGSAVASPVTTTETMRYADLAGSWDSTVPAVATDHAFAAGAERLATNAGILAGGALGTISVDFRNQASNSVPALVNIAADTGVQVAPADLLTDNNEILITFPNGVGDVNAVAVAGAGACTGPVANVFTCAASAAQLTGLSGAAITYTVAGGATPPVTPEQTVTAELVVDPQADYVLAGFTGDLADIKHDNGLRTAVVDATAGGGNFAWVRFGSGGTESNFRVSLPTSADAAGITEVRVAANAGNGVTGGTTTLLPGTAETGFKASGSTITFNSRALGAASGETGNADITSVTFQYDESILGAPGVGDLKIEDASIDRQLVNRTPGSFVATPGLGTDN
jgi:hypothetical protein